jgi:hypothetical protein
MVYQTNKMNSNSFKNILRLVLVIVCVKGNLSGSDGTIKSSAIHGQKKSGFDSFSLEEKNQYLNELIEICNTLKSDNNIDEYHAQNCDDYNQDTTSFNESLSSETFSEFSELPISLSNNESEQTIPRVSQILTEKTEKYKSSLLNQKTKAKIRVCLNQRSKEDKMRNPSVYDNDDYDGNYYDHQLVSNNDVIGISMYIYV